MEEEEEEEAVWELEVMSRAVRKGLLEYVLLDSFRIFFLLFLCSLYI